MIALTRLMQGPEPTFEDRVRAAISLMAINVTQFIAEACAEEPDQLAELPEVDVRREIALRVALDIAERIGKPDTDA
jgi:hypothetical protein